MLSATKQLYSILSSFALKALEGVLAFCKTHTFCQSCLISDGREGEHCSLLLLLANRDFEGQEYTAFPESTWGDVTTGVCCQPDLPPLVAAEQREATASLSCSFFTTTMALDGYRQQATLPSCHF